MKKIKELPNNNTAANIISRMIQNNRHGVFVGNAWGINYKGYEIIPVIDSYQAKWLGKGTVGVLLLDNDGYAVGLEPEAYQWEVENDIPVLDRDVYMDEEICGQMVVCRKIA